MTGNIPVSSHICQELASLGINHPRIGASHLHKLAKCQGICGDDDGDAFECSIASASQTYTMMISLH